MKTYEFTIKFVGKGDTVDDAFADGLDSMELVESDTVNLSSAEAVLIEEEDEDAP